MSSTHKMRNRQRSLMVAAVLSMLALCPPVIAGVVGYQGLTAFNAAITGMSTSTTNFDAAANGSAYMAGPGFTLALSGPDAPALTPTIANQFWTTSGTQYLGLNNSDTAFEAGDSLTFNFANPIQAFGLFIIGTSDVSAGDITLTVGGASVSNGAIADITDGNGSFAYYLGVVNSGPGGFSSVTLNDLDPQTARLLNIAIDDVTLAQTQGGPGIPEPGTIALLLAGVVAQRSLSRRKST